MQQQCTKQNVGKLLMPIKLNEIVSKNNVNYVLRTTNPFNVNIIRSS